MSKILVVDDEPDVLDALQCVIGDHLHGVEILVADSGAGALRVLRNHPVDLVVCDQRMPGMDGLHLLAEVERQWPGTPTILVTAWGIETIREMGPSVAGQCILQKPFDPSALLGEIRDSLATKHLVPIIA